MRHWMLLVERATDDIDRQAVVDGLYDHMDWSAYSAELVLRQYAHEHGIDLNDDEWDGLSRDATKLVDRTTPEFKEWFGDWVEEQYGDAEWDILSRVQDHHITLWRVITAPPNWTPVGRHPGIFWSYIEDAAEAHWGQFQDDHVEWKMQAKVSVDDIDWVTTLMMNAQPDYSDEKEIRLKTDSNVVVEKYWRLK